MITCVMNGYEAYWDEPNQKWRYTDNDECTKDNLRTDITILKEMDLSDRTIKHIEDGIYTAGLTSHEVKEVLERIMISASLSPVERGYALFKFGYDHGFFTGCDRTSIAMSEEATADSENKE